MAADLGLAKSTISLIESGTRDTTTDVVERWLAVCNHRLDVRSVEGVDPRMADIARRVERVLVAADPAQIDLLDALIATIEARQQMSHL